MAVTDDLGTMPVPDPEPARAGLGLGNPSGLTALDVAVSWMLGSEPAGPLPPAPRGRSFVDVLGDLLEPALSSGRCFVAFSAGRESILLLAAATSVARSRGYADPVPLTLTFAADPRPRERERQERVLSTLRLADWQRVEIADELELVGPYARRALRDTGLLFPATAYILLPLLDIARGGWLIVGGGLADFYAYWRWRRVADLLARRRRPSRRAVRELPLALAPARLRRRILRDRIPLPAYPWLRPAAAADVRAALLERVTSAPLRFDRAIEASRSHRCYRGVGGSFEALAASAGARFLMPFRTDAWLAASTAAGGPWGFGSRTATVLRHGGHLLPHELLTSSDGPTPAAALDGPAVRAFCEQWTGEGVDTEIVDASVLREQWTHDPVPWGTRTLLQLAFAHDGGLRTDRLKKGGTALTRAGSRRQSEEPAPST